jgi:hypothetical protein
MIAPHLLAPFVLHSLAIFCTHSVIPLLLIDILSIVCQRNTKHVVIWCHSSQRKVLIDHICHVSMENLGLQSNADNDFPDLLMQDF